MKNLIPVFVLSILAVSVSAQNFPYDRFIQSKTTFLGLDFTYARFINHDAFTDPQVIKDKFLYQWNRLPELEPEKYDFNKYTLNAKSEIFLDIMDERNRTIDLLVLIQDEYYDLDMEQIPHIVNEIEFGDLNGLASFFIVGTYNKNTVMGTYFFVVYDIDADRILFTKKYAAKPGGFGVRNYWARTYYNTLMLMEKDWEKNWSKGN